MKRYTVLLIPEREDGGYTVRVPALPGLTSYGENLSEALANAKDAIELCVADLIAHGEPVPEETEQPRLETIQIDEAAV